MLVFRRQHRSACFAVLMLLASAPVSIAQDDPIAVAERLYADRRNLDSVGKAIAILRHAPGSESDRYERHWRLAKYFQFLGDHLSDKREKKKNFERGVEAAKTAIAARTDAPEGYFWLAVNYLQLAQLRSFWTKWRLVKPIRKALETVVRLDPEHENGSAAAVLGKIDVEVPRLFGGNLKRGIERLEAAVKIGPDNSLIKLFLAEGYLKAKRKAAAKKLLEEILVMVPDAGYEIEYMENQQQARLLLRKEFGE